MGVLINGSLKRGSKDVYPSAINRVSLWALGHVILRDGYGGKGKKERKGVCKTAKGVNSRGQCWPARMPTATDKK